MTEQEWLQATDPGPMLDFLKGRASERKRRLFACACCRRIWDSLPTDACRQAVKSAERYADGQASERELNRAWSAVVASAEEEGINLLDSYEQELIEWGRIPTGSAFLACLGLVGEGKVDAEQAASSAAQEVAWDATNQLRAGKDAESLIFHAHYRTEQAAQTLLLRDIYKSPFRPLPFNPAWLAWHGGQVVSMAQ